MPSKEPMFFTPGERAEIVEGALEAIANGSSLRTFILSRGLKYNTVWEWLTDDKTETPRAYARAKLAGTHALAEECLEIADDGAGDIIVNEDGTERTNTEVVQRAKLRIDTRLRLIGKWNRKDYGEKTTIVGGDEGDAPVQIVGDRDRAKAVAALIMRAKSAD